jgi:hypothetical protein
MARSRLVVETRPHTRLSSFWLHISSNTSSYSEESHEWNTLADLIRHTFFILQYWLEKRLDELAQFKTRLQFRRAHQLDKPTFKQSSPKEYNFNCMNLEVKRKFTNLAISLLSQQGRVTLRRRHPKVHEHSRMVHQDSKQHNRVTEGSATTRGFLMVNGASMKMHEANPLNGV